jgi:hypothetical protein
MKRDEVIALIKCVPEVDVPKIVFVVRGAPALNLDILFRYDPNFIIFRGRESGTNDDGRAFFLPYDEILYIKLERVVTIPDLKDMFGAPPVDSGDDPFADADIEAIAADLAETPGPARAANMDPAAIAKQNLLERIRAARTSAGVTKR